MTAAVFEDALTRLMQAGFSFGAAKTLSVDAWQAFGPSRSILDIRTSLPTTPSAGDSYIITTGSFPNQIAIFGTDGIWHHSVPSTGDQVYVVSISAYYSYIGSVWVPSPTPPITSLTFKASLPNTVTIPLNARIQSYGLTPQDYGAAMDGVTNDLTALTNFAAGAGEPYFVPAGTLNLSADMAWPDIYIGQLTIDPQLVQNGAGRLQTKGWMVSGRGIHDLGSKLFANFFLKNSYDTSYDSEIPNPFQMATYAINNSGGVRAVAFFSRGEAMIGGGGAFGANTSSIKNVVGAGAIACEYDFHNNAITDIVASIAADGTLTVTSIVDGSGIYTGADVNGVGVGVDTGVGAQLTSTEPGGVLHLRGTYATTNHLGQVVSSEAMVVTEPNTTGVTIGSKGTQIGGEGLTFTSGNSSNLMQVNIKLNNFTTQGILVGNAFGTIPDSMIVVAGQYGVSEMDFPSFFVGPTFATAGGRVSILGGDGNTGNFPQVYVSQDGAAASNIGIHYRALGTEGHYFYSHANGTVGNSPLFYMKDRASGGANAVVVTHPGTAAEGGFIGVEGAASVPATTAPMTYYTLGNKNHFFYGNYTYGTGGNLILELGNVNSAANNLKISPAVASSFPIIAAEGNDADIDVALNPKGAGLLRFGTRTAIGAETITGYITIKDSSGTSRKLAVVS